MIRLSAAIFLYLGLAFAALAQNQPNPAIVGNTGAYNSSPPTCTSGQWCSMQTDVNGNTKITGTVTTTTGNAIGITPTDHTITSATGASQQIMAANATRHSLTIENTGNANCGVNPTGGTAAIGGAGTITLSPLGAYTPRVPTLSAVTIICTAAQPIYGDDN